MKKLMSCLLLIGFATSGFSTGKNFIPQEKAPAQEQVQQQKKAINVFDKKKRRHGYWEFYWDDNDTTSLANKGEFKHGEQVGTWTYFNEDGTLQKKETKKKLGRRYLTTTYHPNGKIEKVGMAKVKKEKGYLNYYWYGDWKCYDEQGNYVKTETYKKGEQVE